MKILVFGEVLWDCFDYNRVIGGAPFNFCAHLAKLSGLKKPDTPEFRVSLVSAVGKDVLGGKARKVIRNYNIADDYVADVNYPTGVCKVTLAGDGTPIYDLGENMAYDNITADVRAINEEGKQDFLYFGTLALRNAVSKNTLIQIITECEFGEILCDINIRQNFYSTESVRLCLESCTMLKVSHDELYVFEKLGLINEKTVNPGENPDYTELCKELSQRYNIKIIIITTGKNGAAIYDARNGKFLYSEKPRGKLVSAVGAGDSFLACFTYNYLHEKPLDVCIARAVKLSSYVVTQLGAVPDYNSELMEELI
ncbi:MAG: PfkB family carbohydrate kinase [Oscillospiraceae bacterium]|nr:PfkB family carbohydrate kinase [Oscillospiraceae bacterium]